MDARRRGHDKLGHPPHAGAAALCPALNLTPIAPYHPRVDFDLAIALLKVAGALAGGLLGAAAIFTDFHDHGTGRLRPWGKAVLVGIIASSFVGVVTSVVEAWKAKSESQEQAERTEAVLRQVSRAIQPITDLKVNFWMELPPGNPIVDGYITRVSTAIEERLPELNKRIPPLEQKHKGLDPWARGFKGEVTHVSIKPESDLWPNGEAERHLDVLAKFMALSVEMFRVPIDPGAYAPVHGNSDFGVHAFLGKDVRIDWDLEKKRLVFIGRDHYEKSFWATNGRITSVVDLHGAQLMIFPPWAAEYDLKALLGPDVDKDTAERRKLVHSLELRSVTLGLGEGRSIHLRGSQFKKRAFAAGFPVFVVEFPKDQRAFEDFVRARASD